MNLDKNQLFFLTLVSTGLWEKSNGRLRHDHLFNVNWKTVFHMAEEQSVVGLVTSGIELLHIPVPKVWRLQFIGSTLQIEQRNKAMNEFLASLVERMRTAGIYVNLVKGQAVAQCYERPLWRTSGDIDLLLSEDNYEKAKTFLLPLSTGNKPERLYSKEQGMSIEDWYVEVHGTLRTGLSARIDMSIDEVFRDVFYNGNVRSWLNGKTQIFIPAPDDDVFFVFTHFIKHFYKEGMNIRQICDWCRLLWIYQDKINKELLERRLQTSGLMSEWQAFAGVAVDYLGMPEDAMPLYVAKNNHKATHLTKLILDANPHHLGRYTFSIASLFPLDTIKFLPSIFMNINSLKIKEKLTNKRKRDVYSLKKR